MEKKEKLTRKERREKRKNARNARIARCRGLKNFLFWLAGFMLFPAVIAVAVLAVPLKTYINLTGKDSDEIFSEQLSNQALVPAITNITNYGIADLKFLRGTIENALSGIGLGNAISINEENFNKFNFNGSSGVTLVDCLNITLSLKGLKDLGVDLGSILEIEALNTYELVPTEKLPVVGTEFNAHDYYYISTPASEPDVTAVYSRAFTDEGQYVTGVTAETPLYYPALTEISVLEVSQVFDTALGRIPAVDLISTFSGEIAEDNIIYKVLDGKTVGDLDTVNVDDMLVSDLLTLDAETLKILCDAVVVEDGEAQPTKDTITVKQISTVNVDNIKLETVIERNTDNQKLWNILDSAITPSEADGIARIKDLSGTSFNTDNILLSSVLEQGSNQKLEDIIVQATGASSYAEVKINDLSNFNSDLIKLSLVLELPTAENSYKNQDLWNILKDATGKTDMTAITLADLNDFNIDNIKMSSVIKESSNQKLADIIVQATGNTSYENVKISDLSNFSSDLIKLSLVLEMPTAENSYKNQDLWNILKDATGKTDMTAIILADLNSFNIDNIKLSSVIKESSNQKLATIIAEATNKSYSLVSVSDLSGTDALGQPKFDIARVKLGTVIDKAEVADNKLLYELASDSTVTLANISTKANDVKLNKVFEVEVFTKTSSKAVTFYDNATCTYRLEADGSYVRDDAGEYYISKSANVWLFLFYMGSTEHDEKTGLPAKYTPTDVTYGSMVESMSDTADKISHATIRELVASGELADESHYSTLSMYKLVLTDALKPSVS